MLTYKHAEVTHVSFEHRGPETKYAAVEVKMPLDEADAYQARTHEWVSFVYWSNGTRSYGKQWIYSTTGRLAYIGAGANGDEIVARYDRKGRE